MSAENIFESTVKCLISQAVEKHQAGQWDEAELLYNQVLKTEVVDDQDDSKSQYLPIVMGNLANIYEQQGKLDAAIKLYQQTLELKPEYAEIYYNLGNVFLRQGKLDAAKESYQQALKLKPNYAQAHHNLGNVLQQQGNLDAAIASYQQALKVQPNYAQAHHHLGDVFLKQNKLNAAADSYQQALKLQPNYFQTHHQLGSVLKLQGKLDEAVKSYQQAISLKPNYADVHYNLGSTFYEQGNLEAAIEWYYQALKINPDFAPAKFGTVISQLPIIYSSVDEIHLKRNHYQQHLQNLAHYYQTNSPQRAGAVEAVGSLQPFYLAYQGLNDRDLQKTYGEMICQLMASRYPQWCQPVEQLPQIAANEKIRIGFVSKFFYKHSVWKIPMKGWVENLDRSKFELFGYYTGNIWDEETAGAARVFDKFTRASLGLEQWAKIIEKDKLHILIFPEFGMDPTTVQIGCLKLAPIQVVFGGHPETSGLPTIDYHLTSDLMEPENAQEHYTEQLVRLPNLAIHYTPLVTQIQPRTKKDIGITDDEIMFWSCQSLYKYLPQHDDVFPRIAKELSNAKFVFIQNPSEYVTEVFRQRLKQAFDEFGLNYQDYCIFLSRLNSQEFASTAAIADVFLDNIGWSGNNTTMESVAYDLPIVTYPTEMMRGRHTMAIMKMMGIEETIAATKEDYVKIAVRLGQDAEYRQYISQQIAENKHKLYRDLKPVRALEDFLLRILGKESTFNQSQWDDASAFEVQFLINSAFEKYNLGKLYVAESLYKQALQIQPSNINAQLSLAEIFQEQNRLDEAIVAYQQLLTLVPNRSIASAAYNNLGNAFNTQGNTEAAVEAYQKAIEIQPDLVSAYYYNLANVLTEQLKLEAAVKAYEKALELQPDSVAAKFGICMGQLPIIYKNVAEIDIKRNIYKQHLQDLATYCQQASNQELKSAADAVGSLQPFYLAYQGLNDRYLQQIYGEMLVQIMSRCYPQWSQPLSLPDLKPNEKIRVGFVSRFFYGHSVWKIPMKGWVENLDKSEFELFGYHTGNIRDEETTKAAKVFDKFTQGTRSLEEWAKIIEKDQLHILIFPEFGMERTTLQIGCLKLAPIQVMFGGHPETSGLPTIDYHLSSDLMEPENAQEHYTEQLVRLPNMAIHYTLLPVQLQPKTKKDIGIADHEIMFWSCQSLFKYLPQHDDVFPRIAKELRNAKFVFIRHTSEYVTEVFCQRLKQAFDEFGLNYQDYCIFLPRLNNQEFASTAAIADVFLDNIGWSGNNTTMETTAYNVPVVTYPTEMMRGRHAMAIMKMMGIEETIAATKEDYVKIAVRLGQDAEYRQYISQQIAENKHKLYQDLKPVRALEDFLFQVVNKPRKCGEREIVEMFQLAMQYQRTNCLAEAEQLYRQILDKQPNHPDALYGLGILAQQMGQLEIAEQWLSASAQVQPNSVKTWFSLGNLCQVQGKLATAEVAYKQAIALRPDAVPIYNNLGYTLQQQGKFDEAVACYQKALEIQPNCLEAEVNLGNTLYLQGKLSAVQKAEYSGLNYKLGVARKQAGDLKTALAYYRQAIALHPDLVDSDYNRDGENLEQAIAGYEKVLDGIQQKVTVTTA
jgi:protein O-GlcNAc transferase